jgi:CheY-like chemotaxis protein
VLLVDDEEGVRAVARRVLERAGYRVFEAANGADALALAEREPPDLVVTDLAMPGGSGIGLAEELASRTPDLPVLFITGYSEAAANYFVPMRTRSLLTKPFESRHLLARVQELLASRGR